MKEMQDAMEVATVIATALARKVTMVHAGLAQTHTSPYVYAGGVTDRLSVRMRHQDLRGSWCRVVFPPSVGRNRVAPVFSLGKTTPNDDCARSAARAVPAPETAVRTAGSNAGAACDPPSKRSSLQ